LALSALNPSGNKRDRTQSNESEDVSGIICFSYSIPFYPHFVCENLSSSRTVGRLHSRAQTRRRKTAGIWVLRRSAEYHAFL
jgi:hypothetical protein